MGSWITLSCTREEILNTLKETEPEKKIKEGYFIEKDGKLYRALRILKTLTLKKLGKKVKSPHATYQYTKNFKELGIDLLQVQKLVQKGFYLVQDSWAQFGKHSFTRFSDHEPPEVKTNRIESKYGTFTYSGYFEFTKNGVALQDSQESFKSGVAIVVEQFINIIPRIAFCFPMDDIKIFRETMSTISKQLMSWSEQFAKGIKPDPKQMKEARLEALPNYKNVMAILDGLASQESSGGTISRIYELFILPMSSDSVERVTNKMLEATKPRWNLLFSIPKTIPKTFMLNVKAVSGASRIFLVESTKTFSDLKSIINIAFGLKSIEEKREHFCTKYSCANANEQIELFRVFRTYNSSMNYLVNREKIMDIEVVDSDNSDYEQLPLCISSEGEYKGKFIDKDTINKKLKEKFIDENK